jgi:imidazolonepropionase-like amidohydrolase
MKILLGIAGLLLTACAHLNPPTVALRNVTVVNVIDGSLRADQTVLITGNRITTVGPTTEVIVSRNADVIDAAGGFLIPGLWDMHVHSVANVALDMAVHSVQAADWHFPLFLAWGVTGVRNMNDGTGDVTLELTNSIKRRLATGALHGPRFITNGPSIDGDPPLASNAAVVRTAEQARAAVNKLVDSHADFIKVYENLSREAYFALMDQAQRRGIPVDGHVPFRVTPEEAADAGQRTFEHVLAMAAGCSTTAAAERERFASVLSPRAGSPALDGLTPMTLFHHERALYDSRDPAACAPTIAAYLRNEVADTPNIVAYRDVVDAKEIFANTRRMRLVPEVIRRNWESMPGTDLYQEMQSVLRPLVALYSQNARLLNEADVLLLAGTDVGLPALIPGISLHEELELLVEAALTPLQALQTATINPARVLGQADSLGSIEVGKLADVVLLGADPLADIRNTQRIRAVVADGRLYRRADLDRLQDEVEALNQRGAGTAETMPPQLYEMVTETAMPHLEENLR